MLRIIVREVSDTRQRPAKSLGVADIEPLLALTRVAPKPGTDVHLARLYVSAAGGQKLTVNASFIPTVTPARGLWQYIAQALQAGLPQRSKI